MLPKELIGCRVKYKEDLRYEHRGVLGKIINMHISGSANNYPKLILLTPDKTFKKIDYDHIEIIEEDFNKVYNIIQPNPIDNRFEIMDI